MIKLLRILATALSLTLVAFLFTGCGGEETAPAVTKASTSKSSKTTAAATLSRPEDLVGQIVVPTDQSPADFKKAIESRRPIVVTFYINGPYDDTQVRTAVQSLKGKYGGEVDFFDYLYTDGQKYGDLTMLLNVGASPSVIIINRQSQVQRAWSGWADAKSIEQGVIEAKDKKAQ